MGWWTYIKTVARAKCRKKSGGNALRNTWYFNLTIHDEKRVRVCYYGGARGESSVSPVAEGVLGSGWTLVSGEATER